METVYNWDWRNFILPELTKMEQVKQRSKIQARSDNMDFRKIAVVLLILSILLSGCLPGKQSGDKRAENDTAATVHNGEKSGGQNEETVQPDTDTLPEGSNVSRNEAVDKNGSAMVGDTSANGTDSGNVKDGGGNGADGIVDLIPIDQLPELTMEPRTPYTKEEIEAFIPNYLTPVYHENFRYQVREFTERPPKFVIDIGNTGSETLVITDKNLYFSIFDLEGNEAAGSRVQGAPVKIAPGEIKRVTVTAKNPDASLVYLEIGGIIYPLSSPYFRALPYEQDDVTDTKPYNKTFYDLRDEEGNPYVISNEARFVVGNGKAKMAGFGVMVLANERIGAIEKGDGLLALVKVKIANTSGEVMTIDRIVSDGAGENIVFTEKDLEILGDKKLPFRIEPYSIVEGWIPFRLGDGREGHGIVFYTNLGGFVIGHLQCYPIIKE